MDVYAQLLNGAPPLNTSRSTRKKNARQVLNEKALHRMLRLEPEQNAVLVSDFCSCKFKNLENYAKPWLMYIPQLFSDGLT
jgi:hypothetical protein